MTSPSTYRRWVGLLLILAIVEVIYVFVVSAGKMVGWPTYMGYYDLLAEGFRSGHLYLPIRPSPMLLAQPDPYADSSIPYWAPDISLYGNHFFFYWGPFPALVLAAVKSLFHIRKSVGDQYPVFGLLSVYAISATILIDKMTRRLVVSPPFYLVAAGLLAVTLGCPALHLLASTSVYMVAVIGAQAFLMLGAVFAADCVFEAQARAPRAWRLAATGVAWVIAAACRMSCSVAMGLLVVLTVAAVAYQRSPESRGLALAARWRHALRAALWLGAPIVVGFFFLLLYNRLRFDSWFDTGLGRQLTTWKFTFAPRYFVANIYTYLFRRFSLSCAFPYLVVPYLPRLAGPLPPWLPLQRGYMVPEPIIGLLVAAPITWLIPAAIRGTVRSIRQLAGGGTGATAIQAWYGLAFLIMGTVTMLAPLGLYMATMRYEMDGAPGALLLSVFGVWVLYAQTGASVRARRVVASLCVALAAVTIVIGLLLGYQGYTGHFAQWNPQLSAALERSLSFCRQPGH